MPIRGRADGVREYLRPWYLRHVYFRAFPRRKPSYFEDCWRFPHAPLDHCQSLIDPAAPSSRDFLFLPMTDWHTRIQRSQFLAQALAALGHRCFLLNPHLGREFQTSRQVSPQLARLKSNIYEMHVRLPREPVYHHRNLRDRESDLLAGAIGELTGIAGLSNLTQIVSFPLWYRVAITIRDRSGAPVVYDCHDRMSGFSNVASEIAALEPALVAASDLVICSAESLRAHCLASGAFADRCHVVRNAVEKMPSPDLSLPRAQPVIGYLGAIEDWFDAEAIRSAALARPAWRFVLAGRIETGAIEALQGLPNIEFAGEISRDRVPDLLAGFDVGMIPFRLNPLTIAADPIKLYEYLGAGLPVVSARLPETQRFAGYIRYYESLGDFVEAIESALVERDETTRKRRQLAVAEETWDSRARLILRLTERTQNGRLCASVST